MLSACLLAGLPGWPAEPGAFAERLAGRAWSVVLSWDLPPADVANVFGNVWRANTLPRARHHLPMSRPCCLRVVIRCGRAPLRYRCWGSQRRDQRRAFDYRRDYLGSGAMACGRSKARRCRRSSTSSTRIKTRSRRLPGGLAWGDPGL